MHKHTLFISAVALMLAACSSNHGSSRSASPQSSAAPPAAPMMAPTTPDMTADEIRAAFIGKPMMFRSADGTITAVGAWNPNGTVTAHWTNHTNGQSGDFISHYTLTGNRYCVIGDNSQTRCGHMRMMDGKIYELTDDGKIWGIYTPQPGT